MLRALVWKDLRINRLPLLMGVFLLVAPYIIVGVAVRGMPLWEEATAASAWAILSGHLIAVERGDRSAEFLGYLPPSRRMVLLSKALVLLGAAFAIWGLNLALHVTAAWMSPASDAAHDLTSHLASLPRFAAIGALGAGAGWWASAILDNSGLAVALGLAAPAALFGILTGTHSAFNYPTEISFATTYFNLCPVLSVAFFTLGTWTYLRRVEP
jgi:hypothetical protein